MTKLAIDLLAITGIGLAMGVIFWCGYETGQRQATQRWLEVFNRRNER